MRGIGDGLTSMADLVRQAPSRVAASECAVCKGTEHVLTCRTAVEVEATRAHAPPTHQPLVTMALV